MMLGFGFLPSENLGGLFFFSFFFKNHHYEEPQPLRLHIYNIYNF